MTVAAVHALLVRCDLVPLPPRAGQPPADRSPDADGPAGIGSVLVVPDQSMDMPAIILALKAQGILPILLPTLQDAAEALAVWHPRTVLLHAGQRGWPLLPPILADSGIPCVLMGTSQQLGIAQHLRADFVELPVPATPEEIAQVARRAIGPTPADKLADRIDLEVLRLDLLTRTIEIQGRQTVLPPKEFELLVRLALQPGVPIAAIELLRRAWPESPATTVTELHTRIWRLRRLIGDHQRSRPLIVNRRGSGYLLDLAGLPPG